MAWGISLLPTDSLVPLPGPLAQLAEQRTFNPRVPGSIPGRPTFVSSYRSGAVARGLQRLSRHTAGHGPTLPDGPVRDRRGQWPTTHRCTWPGGHRIGRSGKPHARTHPITEVQKSCGSSHGVLVLFTQWSLWPPKKRAVNQKSLTLFMFERNTECPSPAF